MNKQDSGFHWTDVPAFFKSRLFRYTLLRLFIFFALLWILQTLALDLYTNHGQRLRLGNYTGLPLEKAGKQAYAKGFEIIVSDSVFLTGKPGGYVITQVPKPGSFVKRGRKVYVTVTRFGSEEVDSEVLFSSYGKKYQHKKAELFNLYELKSRIKATEYDPGPAGHILKVYFKDRLLVDKNTQEAGVMIPKGETLDFVVSASTGGTVEIPELVCRSYSEALFELDAASLVPGNVDLTEESANKDSMFVVRQNPPFHRGSTIPMGQAVDITLSVSLPDGCR